jgi:hypothetical protein
MPRGTAPAAATGQPQRGPGYPADYIPADGGQRTALGAQPLRARRSACPRAEQPYDAAAFIDCAALHRTDRTFCRPSGPACVLDFRRPAGRFTAHAELSAFIHADIFAPKMTMRVHPVDRCDHLTELQVAQKVVLGH